MPRPDLELPGAIQPDTPPLRNREDAGQNRSRSDQSDQIESSRTRSGIPLLRYIMSALEPFGRNPDIPGSCRVSDAGRRTKVVGARTRGPRTMGYGVFDFGGLWALVGAANMGTDLRADSLLFGSQRGCLNADRPTWAGMRPLLSRGDAVSPVLRSAVAAATFADEPCRVTTQISRMSF